MYGLLILGQAWYLTPPFVIMALADDDTPEKTRQEIARKLLRFPVPNEFTVGRPEFPNIHEEFKLEDLIKEDSWFIFHVIGQEDAESHEWLKSDVKMWKKIEKFNEFKDFVHKIDVVNDRAERGVKLIQEYIGSAHSESDLQDLLLVVNDQKSKLPNLNKVLLLKFYTLIKILK